MENYMDTGGINLVTMEVIGVIILLEVIAWAVMRTKSKGRSTSNPTTEQATRDLYAEEECRRKDGADDL